MSERTRPAAGAPSRPRWIIHVDGAARGNPGPAAAGLVVLDAAGQPVRRIGRRLGALPNNQAEYRALLIALTEVARLPPGPVLVRMDSELVVRQMTGQYRVKHPELQRLFAQVQQLTARLERVAFVHVPRAQNAEADRLANLALDGREVDEGNLTPDPD